MLILFFLLFWRYKKLKSTLRLVMSQTGVFEKLKYGASKNQNGIVSLSAATDYYPFGMPMPNRQIVNGEPYRYGYQGEFAETDPETGTFNSCFIIYCCV